MGTTYLSVAVTEDGKDKPLASNARIRLEFRDGGLSVSAGCNSLGGQVATAGGTLVMDQYGGTEIGCRPALQAQDEWIMKLLLDRPTWKLEGDVLSITRGSTTLTLKDRKIVEPDLPLEGTRWSVESVVSGLALEHPAGAGSAYLIIKGNQVTGSTGCNTFSGPITRGRSSLTFGAFKVTTGGCTGDPAYLERAVLANLNGTLTYTITSNHLELRAANNQRGLDLRAPR